MVTEKLLNWELYSPPTRLRVTILKVWNNRVMDIFLLLLKEVVRHSIEGVWPQLIVSHKYLQNHINHDTTIDTDDNTYDFTTLLKYFQLYQKKLLEIIVVWFLKK